MLVVFMVLDQQFVLASFSIFGRVRRFFLLYQDLDLFLSLPVAPIYDYEFHYYISVYFISSYFCSWTYLSYYYHLFFLFVDSFLLLTSPSTSTFYYNTPTWYFPSSTANSLVALQDCYVMDQAEKKLCQIH